MPVNTVKAREHPGSSSFDLTIPAEIVKEYDLQAGDVFQVVAEETDDNELELKYERVFKQPNEE